MIAIDDLAADPAALRRAYGCFPSGVTAVCATVGGTPAGMAASSFTCVSMSPPLVSFGVQNSSTTWPRLRRCARLGISVLGAAHDDVCLSLSSKHGDRFAGVAWEAATSGAIFVLGATAWLECSIDEEILAGDHTIVLLRIHQLHADPEAAPLVFHASQFRLLATD